MRPRFVLTLVFVVCLCLATYFGPRFEAQRAQGNRSKSVFAALMGDSRKMFANHFFAKADAYFHNGRYPTIFDRVKTPGASHMTPPKGDHEDEHADHKDTGDHHEGEHGDQCDHDKEADEKEGFDFGGPPKDWIEAFGRRFTFTGHAHLEGNGQEREILPWLKLSAEMDSHRVQTYVTASYWLRSRLGKALEAEQFLREGLRANPDSYEILLELGRAYDESKKDPGVARNLWEIALSKWRQQEKAGAKPDELVLMEILGRLVHAEEQGGDPNRLIYYLQELKTLSPNPDAIEKQIQDAKAKLNSQSP